MPLGNRNRRHTAVFGVIGFVSHRCDDYENKRSEVFERYPVLTPFDVIEGLNIGKHGKNLSAADIDVAFRNICTFTS